MTTFITGGTTSLGRVLVKELVRQGEALRILVRPESGRAGLELPGVEFVRGDITDAVAVRKGITGCDRVCHLASVTGRHHSDADVWRINRDGTRSVLQAALDMRVRSVVQVSSLFVLGPTPGERPADETKPIDFSALKNVFQKSRLVADDIALEFAEKGLDVRLVYPGFGFGFASAYGHPGLANETLLRMAAGKSVSILGNGWNRICLTYYKDTAQGINLAHQRGRAGESYILSGDCLPLPKIWEVVADVLGKEPPTRRVPLWMGKLTSAMGSWFTGKAAYSPEFFTIMRNDWNYTNLKARRELGWQPRSLHDAMAETWAEFQSIGWQGDRKKLTRVARRA